MVESPERNARIRFAKFDTVKISVCVITLNEEANLDRCLTSCKDLAEEIVVLDSGSTDATESIANRFQARWHKREWLGYVGQKNRLLDLAKHEWVLSLDADEELSPNLREEIRGLALDDAPDAIAGFSMPRCVLYDGRWIRHGDWYPDRLVRLFRREQARFEGGKVHERLSIQGSVQALEGEIFHYSFTDSSDHWRRCQHYARLWAETRIEKGKTAGPLAPVLHSAFRWLRGYVLRFGFLDGRQGWNIAMMSAKEVHLKYRLLRTLPRQGRSS